MSRQISPLRSPVPSCRATVLGAPTQATVLGAQANILGALPQATMSWGAPWNNDHDLSQPSWSGAAGWASDQWEDSSWTREWDKHEEPGPDKQKRPNLPHVTTLGLKHPLPLDERKEYLPASGMGA